MKLYLYRIRTRQDTTDGVLRSENGQRICDTAEHTPSRLPPGTYNVVLKKHLKYEHRAPCFEEGYIIHGNGVYGKDFGASIAVGDHLVPGVVIRSYPYFRRIVKSIEKSLRRHHKVELVIV